MTLQQNLKRYREEAGLKQNQLAAMAGVPQSQISEIETGKRLSTRFLPEIAAALKKQPGDLDERYVAQAEGIFKPPPAFMNNTDTMPVYASAEGGNGQVIVSTDEIDRVARPYTLEGIPDAYAILVTGESMVPAYEPGDYAWVNPRLPPHRDTDCILYAIDEITGESKATIKRLISWDEKAWKLRQFTPAKDFPLERAEWAKHHRVVGNFRRR